LSCDSEEHKKPFFTFLVILFIKNWLLALFGFLQTLQPKKIKNFKDKKILNNYVSGEIFFNA
jgi:hypothetical protein